MLTTIGVLASLSAATAYAAQAGGIGIYPSAGGTPSVPWFRYQLPPGSSHSDSVTVENRSGSATDLLIYPVDAAPTGDGGFGMMPQATRPTDAGSWIQLATSRLQLSPGGTAVVPFRFTVPPATSVGPHYAGIVIQPQAITQNGWNGSVGIQIVSRVGVRVYETVPGTAHPRLAIDWLHPLTAAGHLGFELSIHNRGNTIAVPTGELTVTALGGRVAARVRLSAGRSLPPGSQLSSRIPTDLTTGWLPQRYTARLQLSDAAAPSQHRVAYTVRFWVGSWARVAVVIMLSILALASGLLIWRQIRKRRARTTGAHEPSTSPSQR
ncbi:MAG TPA: hypothetical protein VMR75_00680 [Candidatus Saccharimonadales bacterium]|nr:hypothetical protein [Candidatus Saccharimonadales bacterium]